MDASRSSAHDEQRDALAGRLFEATLGAFDLLAVHLGLDLGLYAALANGGPASPRELADRAGISPRYAREWLEHQAVTGILTVDNPADGEEQRRYALPSGHAEALLDPDSLSAAAPLARFVLSGARMLPTLADAYRSGGGVAWDAYPGLVEAQEAANRPVFRKLLAQEWLPAIPDLYARLTDRGHPARVADLACGTGWSSVSLAEAFPWIQVTGLDVDEGSIAAARRIAGEQGIGEDRLRFRHADAADHGLDGQFDAVFIIEAVHDLSSPVEVLKEARRLLGHGGVVIVVDERVADAFTVPGDEVERLMYGYSLFFCLANGLVEQPSAATGTVMRTSTLRRYAEAAGFSAVTVMPIEHDFLRVYRLDP